MHASVQISFDRIGSIVEYVITENRPCSMVLRDIHTNIHTNIRIMKTPIGLL